MEKNGKKTKNLHH